MKDKMTFGSFIKEKRINKNYSQKDLAELLFVTESAVSKWERGITYPDITLISDICRVLEISERELIQSSDDNEYRKMKKDSDKYNKLKKTLFWIFNICYITTIIVCFIVNLAVNHTLSWFFIVLSSVLVAYSFCPTFTWIFDKNKKVVFIVSTFISLFLLFLTCSIYTKNYWFMIPTMGLLIGYFLIFYPILFTSQKKYLNDDQYHKLSKWFLLSYNIGILILIVVLLFTINGYKPFNISLGIIIAGGWMAMPIIFGILALLGINFSFVKIILVILLSLLVVVFIIGLGKAIYLRGTEVTKTYNIEESYDKITIKVNTEDINIYLSDVNENRVVCSENKKVTLDVKVVDGVLIIRRVDERKFYDKWFNLSVHKVDLYLSKDTIDLLKIESSTGDINIGKEFNFKDVNIKNSTGDISINSNINNSLNIENSTGDITIRDCNNMGDINIVTSTGDVDFKNVNCKLLNIEIRTGDTELKNVLVEKDLIISGSTGDVDLDGFDAGNIYITLSTGDVEGTILSSKNFIVKSNTGKVDVPETRDGGECRITVSTGNIKIMYK